ncbi:efflux RND transporter periplasmic adaptor subunit, partial [Thermodesulfobacteriota bacterium]
DSFDFKGGLNMKKFFIFIILIAFFGLIGWKVYEKVSASAKMPGRQRGPVPVAVKVEPVRKATVRDVGSFTGTLNPKSMFIVAPKIGGRLEKLLVNIGDRVKRGQLIAVLEDDEYLQQVDQAKAELEVGRARIEESRSKMEIARSELERIRALRQKNSASQSAFDTVEAQFNAQKAMYKVAQAQLLQKEAALKAVQVRLSYTRIHASWEDRGEYRVVGERFRDEGAMLAPNASIVSILENSVLTAVIHVIERDYPKVMTGQRAVLTTDAFPERSFPGKIARVAPLLKETSRQARVEIEVPNLKNLLKPGMFIRIQIEFAKHGDATVVPLTALIKREGRQGIFLADPQESKTRFVPVTLGIVDSELAEVVKPPLAGLVVTLGQHLLRDGSAVVLPGAGPDSKSGTMRDAGPPGREGRPPTGGRP